MLHLKRNSNDAMRMNRKPILKLPFKNRSQTGRWPDRRSAAGHHAGNAGTRGIGETSRTRNNNLPLSSNWWRIDAVSSSLVIVCGCGRP